MTGLDILDFAPCNAVNQTKVDFIADSIRKNGWTGSPILTYGNTLITGSHRLAALQQLFEDGFNIDFDCARDVSDIIDEQIANGKDFVDDILYNLDCLRSIFAGTWVEQYKDDLEEW